MQTFTRLKFSSDIRRWLLTVVASIIVTLQNFSTVWSDNRSSKKTVNLNSKYVNIHHTEKIKLPTPPGKIWVSGLPHESAICSFTLPNIYWPEGKVMFSLVSVCLQSALSILAHCLTLLQYGRYSSYRNAFLLLLYLKSSSYIGCCK